MSAYMRLMSSRGRATSVARFIMFIVVAAVKVFNKIRGVRDRRLR